MIYKSAGIVPIRFTERGTEYLMLRAWSYWDFPKGKVDDGEGLLDTAVRELEEESGITAVNFNWGQQSIETEPYKTKVDGKSAKKIATYYLAEYKDGEVHIEPNPETGEVEHEEFRWMTYNEIVEGIKLSPRIRKVLDWADSIVKGDTND